MGHWLAPATSDDVLLLSALTCVCACPLHMWCRCIETTQVLLSLRADSDTLIASLATTFLKVGNLSIST